MEPLTIPELTDLLVPDFMRAVPVAYHDEINRLQPEPVDSITIPGHEFDRSIVGDLSGNSLVITDDGVSDFYDPTDPGHEFQYKTLDEFLATECIIRADFMLSIPEKYHAGINRLQPVSAADEMAQIKAICRELAPDTDRIVATVQSRLGISFDDAAVAVGTILDARPSTETVRAICLEHRGRPNDAVDAVDAVRREYPGADAALIVGAVWYDVDDEGLKSTDDVSDQEHVRAICQEHPLRIDAIKAVRDQVGLGLKAACIAVDEARADTRQAPVEVPADADDAVWTHWNESVSAPAIRKICQEKCRGRLGDKFRAVCAVQDAFSGITMMTAHIAVSAVWDEIEQAQIDREGSGASPESSSSDDADDWDETPTKPVCFPRSPSEGAAIPADGDLDSGLEPSPKELLEHTLLDAAPTLAWDWYGTDYPLRAVFKHHPVQVALDRVSIGGFVWRGVHNQDFRDAILEKARDAWMLELCQ